jgi:hypothetical protein
MFKRFADGYHWGVMIPLNRRRLRERYDPSMDAVVTGMFRKHFCITFKVMGWFGFKEFRLRVGVQYL